MKKQESPGFSRGEEVKPDTPTAAEWSAAASYAVGDLVSRGGAVYRCLIAHGAEYAGTWGPPATGVWESVS